MTINFYNNKENRFGSRKTKTIKLSGQDFLLVEPSAYIRTVAAEKWFSDLNNAAKTENNLQKAKAFFSISTYLISVCLLEHFRPQFEGKGLTDEDIIDKIHESCRVNLSESDMELLMPDCEEFTNLKFEGADSESQTESLQES